MALTRNVNFRFLLAGLFLYGILSSCSSTRQSASNNDLFPGELADSLVASLERTVCFGKCPAYKISIYRSGYVLYEGKSNVDKIGVYTARLTRDQLEQMGKAADAAGYFDLKDEYRNPHLTDFPTVYIEIRYMGRKKKITHYDASPPEALVEMEKYLDGMFTPETKWQLITQPSDH